MQDDVVDELQGAVFAVAQRMADYVSWAEQVMIELRTLRARVAQLEVAACEELLDGAMADDEGDAKLMERLAAARI